MITDPKFAPKRADLTWLRRRRLPKSAADPQATRAAVGDFMSGRSTHQEPPPAPPTRAAAAAPARTGPAAPAVADFVSGRATRHAPPSPPPPAPSTSSSLDLDEPTPAPATPAPAAPSAPTPTAAAPTSGSLDLDDARPERPVAPQAVPARGRVREDERVRSGGRFLFSVGEPTVTLTRLQSAIGALTFEAACSPEVGDLRLGCAYELVSGDSSTVQLTQGKRSAPKNSRRPLFVAAHERFEQIAIDLRQCLDLRRLIVYAFSEHRQPLTWGGTLLTTTFGGARVELPLETLQSGDAAVLLSLYNVRGEFVLRAEMQTLFGDVREACRQYGFDRITWLDDRTPVD